MRLNCVQSLNVDQTDQPDNEHVSCTLRRVKYRVNATLLNKLGNYNRMRPDVSLWSG